MLTNKIKNTTLPYSLCRLMVRLSKILGVKRFILFGGAAIDLLINLNSSIKINHDLDIGIEGRKKDIINRCKKNLKRCGFQIIGKDRQYFINMNEPVTMIFARNNRWLLDINFMDNLYDVGQFDIESLFFRYPELDYIDRYGAIESLKKKIIHPINGLYKENPILLINRIIDLCSKYNINMSRNPIHRDYINILKKRISQWDIEDEFHGKMAKISFYSKVLKAIKQARRRGIFIKDLATTGILRELMPEIYKPLRNLSPKKKKLLNKARTKSEIANFLIKIINPKDKPKFKYKLRLIYDLRGWDSEDQGLYQS